MGEPAEPDALLGAQVGPFTIVRRIGEGALSAVYLAEHPTLKTRRTVKVMSPHLTQNGTLVRRFSHEARAMGRMRHRNLVEVHDVGQLPGGAWFILREHLDGVPLARFMTSHLGPVPPHLVVHILCGVASGMQLAHEQRFLHRDLKPSNLMLIERDGNPHHAMVLDFGIAELGDDPMGGRRTRSGIMIGTPSYMAPEQLCGTRVTSAADIFALGVIAYQMCTGGAFPYQHGESQLRYVELGAAELYHRQMSAPPADPRDHCSRLSAAWASALLAAVSPDPVRRPTSARAFLVGLASLVAATNDAPDGLTIVRTYARELVDAGIVIDSIHPMRPRALIGGDLGYPGSRYHLGDKVGAGGMAEVFGGTMIGVEGFARRVAIKRVLSGLSEVPAFATMFVAEARIASRLAHPNIVSVLDFLRDHEARLLLVMEFVDGKDLASLLDSGPLAPSLAIFIAVELLRGLGYAHDLADAEAGTRGVVHRDVSPQNLLLSYEGAVKLSDFGLARARAASSGVRSETVRGKPSYMAPEQLIGDAVDGRADLYSVGVMLWEMLARKTLFAGSSREILGQVMFRDVAPPSRVRTGVPDDLAAVVMKLIARDREDRYPTAAAAIEALLRCEDASRDGRGELIALLAERFPRSAAARAALSKTQASGCDPLTVPEPAPTGHGEIAMAVGFWPVRAARPGRRALAIALLVLAISGALALIARGGIARSSAASMTETARP